MRRLMIAVSLLALAAAPALAQGKIWERSKSLMCTTSNFHSCTEEKCDTQALSVQLKLDLDKMSACVVRGPACEDAEAIGLTKVIDGAFLVYIGQDKSDGTILRIHEDGRFSAVGLRKITEHGGYTIVGNCAAE